MTERFCKDCKYSYPWQRMLCERLDYPVGEPLFHQQASTERRNSIFPWVDRCGPEGKYFEPKVPPILPEPFNVKATTKDAA